MWKLSAISSVMLLLGVSLYLSMVPGKVEAVYYSPVDLGANNYEQLNAMVKDYIKILEKAKGSGHQKPISSGQLTLRSPRSELGDMANALRFIQLQNLDRMYTEKNRPRFGKRSEISQDEMMPSYGYSANVIPDEERKRR